MTTTRELADLEQRSYWQATMPPLPDRSGGDLPDAVDVLVIGGGPMGLSAVRRARELGASVALLEAETLGWGGATRNGGMCHPGFKHGVAQLIAAHGEKQGLAIHRESLDGYEHVKAEFEPTGGLSLVVAPSHAAAYPGSVAGLARAG